MGVGGNRADHRMIPDNLRVEPIPHGGCWIWMGKADRHGYGRIFCDGKEGFAHRFSWRRHRGEIPAGMGVLHKCDVTGCVNPDHLFLGAPADNSADKVKKGRHGQERGGRTRRALGYNRGARNVGSKLTEDRVREILGSGESDIVLAERFGVSDTAIWSVRHGRTWRYLSHPEEY